MAVVKWKAAVGLLLVVLLSAGAWIYHHRSEAVYERILQQDGYTLTLIKEQIATEFFLKPEWIPEKTGEEKRLNVVIGEKFATKIVLEKVGKRERDFYIQLNAMPYPDRRSGQFLTTTLVHPNGSYSTPGHLDRWVVTDPAGQDILNMNYSSGDGPGNLSMLFIDDTHLEKLEQGAHVRFSGYNLYGYRQLERGGLETYWVSMTVFGSLIVLALFYLYRRRTIQEERLGVKLLGYFLLGGFTFAINAVKLPLGFAVYMLFIRKPGPNAQIKEKAALLGLLVYFSQLLAPAFAGMVNWQPGDMTIRNVSVESVGIDGVWRTVTAQAPVSNQARLLEFETVLSSGGEVKGLSFHLVERIENRYFHTNAVYDEQEQTLKIQRSTTDEWVQYGEQILAERFFSRVVDLDLMSLRSAGEHPYVKLGLMEDGMRVNYGIKEASTFAVSEEGVREIGDERLPVQGYWVSACGVEENDEYGSGCAGRTDYLFDIVGESPAP